MTSRIDRPAPFSAESYDLGELVLGPIGDDVDALAAGVAAIDPWAANGVTIDAMRHRMLRPWPATFRFALRLDGRLAGYLALRHPFMRGPYVETIALFAEARRRGFARRIVDWMGREVEGEAANIWLCVTEWNAAARAAYAAMGFVEVGPIPDLVVVGQTEIFLRKALAPPLA